MPQHQHPLIPRVERIETRSQDRDPVRLVDPVEIIDRRPILQAIRSALGTVTAAPTPSPMVVGEFVRSDAKQPGADAAGSPREAVESAQRPLERGRGDVFGQWAIAATPMSEGMDSVHVAPVQDGEGVDIDTRLLDELTLVEQVVVVTMVVHRSPA